MHDSLSRPVAALVAGDATQALFMWRGHGIVLLGEREGDRWILARGWMQGDRLDSVRRWSFAQPLLFSSQVRRLVREAGAADAVARAEGARALAWSESVPRAGA